MQVPTLRQVIHITFKNDFLSKSDEFGLKTVDFIMTKHQVFHYFRGDKDLKLLQLLDKWSENDDSENGAGGTMVFCASQANAERVHALLSTERPASGAIGAIKTMSH